MHQNATETFDLTVPDSLGSPIIPTERPSNLIGARTDTELVKTYLDRGGLSEKSIRNTGKELQRFLLWCAARIQRLAGIQTEDLIEYSTFLAGLRPTKQWVSATKWPRKHPNCRPFTGPLSTTSHRQAMIAVRS
jgi:integrase/recombinase XerD